MQNVKNFVIDSSKLAQFRTKWRALCERRSLIDWEMAVLARDIRAELPDGASGDHQFIRVLHDGIGAKGSRANMLIVASKSFRAGLHEKETWLMLGGWPSISFLMGLKQSERSRVLAACIEKTEETGRNLSLGGVRKIAFKLGIETKRSVGRPNRTESERKLAVLRSWIIKNKDKLPKLPGDVTEALGATNLGRLVEIAAHH